MGVEAQYFIDDHKGLPPSLYMDEGYEQHSGRLQNNVTSRIAALGRVCAISLAVHVSPSPASEVVPYFDVDPQVEYDFGAISDDQVSSQYEHKGCELSRKLEKEFSFKRSQWSSVIKVERKTLYNWDKNPDTRIQAKTTARLRELEAFAQEMDKGHSQFLSKLSFGKYAIPELNKLLISSDLNLQNLIEIYEKNYTIFDGLLKRREFDLV